MWAGLRHFISINLKLDTPQNSLAPTPILKIKNNTFDVIEKKSRDYYNLLISNKAQFPNATINIRSEFHLSIDQLKQVFILPHSVAFEPYVKAFQYKILNSILFTKGRVALWPYFFYVASQVVPQICRDIYTTRVIEVARARHK